MGHTCGVGRLLLGHTVRLERVDGVRQVIIRTEVFPRQPVDGVRPPPTISDHVGQLFEGLAGHIAFQAPHDLWSG